MFLLKIKQAFYKLLKLGAYNKTHTVATGVHKLVLGNEILLKGNA